MEAVKSGHQRELDVQAGTTRLQPRAEIRLLLPTTIRCVPTADRAAGIVCTVLQTGVAVGTHTPDIGLHRGLSGQQKGQKGYQAHNLSLMS